MKNELFSIVLKWLLISVIFCAFPSIGATLDTDGTYWVAVDVEPNRHSGVLFQQKHLETGALTLSEPISSDEGSSWYRRNLESGTYQYSYKYCSQVKDWDQWGCSGSFSQLQTYVVVRKVNSISVNFFSNTGTLSISWNALAGITGYELQRKSNTASWQTVYTGSSTSRQQTGLSSSRYQYRVRAKVGNYSGEYSVSNYAYVLKTPSSISVPTSSVKNGSIGISWAAVSTATSYTLQESVNGGGWATIKSQSSRSYTRSGRSNGSYRYKVRACNSAGCSGWRTSANVTVLHPPQIPSSISVPTSTVKNGSIGISWAAVSTTTSYTLQERVNNSSWSTLTNTGHRSYSRAGRGNGSYQYQVRACNSSGCSGWRASSSVTVLLPPQIPSSISVPTSTVKNGSIGINWAAVSTTTSYTLQERVNNGSWSTLTNTGNRSYSRTGRGNGSYRYQVRSCNSSGCSGWRSSATVTVLLPPAVPSSISVPSSTVTNGSIVISWPAASTATSYTLQERINNGSWSTLTNTNSRSYSRTGRANGSYQYQVRACNSSGCSDWGVVSSTVTVLLPPATPSSISVPASTVTNGSIAISWAASATTTTYTLQERVNNGGWSTLSNTGSRSYSRTDRNNGSYQYQVKACNNSGCSSWKLSPNITVSLLAPNEASNYNLGSEGEDGSQFLSWNAVADAAYYEVVVIDSEGKEHVYTVNDASFLLALQMGDYQVIIRSCNFANMCSSGYSLGNYSPSTAVRYQHTDMLGSVVAESDAQGNILSRSHYEPFGKRIDGNKEGIGYTGHLHDKELNLTYMQARYYDPLIGRFYSNDAVDASQHLNLGNLNGFNRYAYANNNPYKYIDPDGNIAILLRPGFQPRVSPITQGVRQGIANNRQAAQSPRGQIQRATQQIQKNMQETVKNSKPEIRQPSIKEAPKSPQDTGRGILTRLVKQLVKNADDLAGANGSMSVNEASTEGAQQMDLDTFKDVMKLNIMSNPELSNPELQQKLELETGV